MVLLRVRNLNKSAFSLLEVLLASIIFVISVTGIFITLAAVRGPVADKENALTAAVFSKQVLEALRSSVNPITYYGSCAQPNGDGSCGDFSLFLGGHEITKATLTGAGLRWPPTLTASNTVCDTAVNGCLVYMVTCQDGTTTSCLQGVDPDMPRQVTLNINWPSSS